METVKNISDNSDSGSKGMSRKETHRLSVTFTDNTIVAPDSLCIPELELNKSQISKKYGHIICLKEVEFLLLFKFLVPRDTIV